MSQSVDEIDLISIYLKRDQDTDERVNEVALLKPLHPHAHFDPALRALYLRSWDLQSSPSLLRRLYVKIQTFVYKKLRLFIPKERQTREAKFKTILALILSQEGLREHLLSDAAKVEHFLKVIEQTAASCGYKDYVNFSEISTQSTSLEISQELTTLSGKRASLIEDFDELNLQSAILPLSERNRLLYALLSQIEKSPVISVLEMEKEDKAATKIVTKTQYVKYHIEKISALGEIHFTRSEDCSTSSIPTFENMQPGARSTTNQRAIFSGEEQEYSLLSCYSGELVTTYNALEQILFLLDQQAEEKMHKALLLTESSAPSTPLLFLSLFSWTELERMSMQFQALNGLYGRGLTGETEQEHPFSCELRPLFYNIPLHSLHATPPETRDTQRDLNIFSLATLSMLALKKIKNLGSHALSATQLQNLQNYIQLFDTLSLEMQNALMACHDEAQRSLFKEKRQLLEQMEQLQNALPPFMLFLEEARMATSSQGASLEILESLQTLFLRHLNVSHAPRGVDEFLNMRLLAHHLALPTSTNCQHSTEYCAAAIALDKAANAFRCFKGHSFLPQRASDSAKDLFKVLYSMYLVWEEPEITSGVSQGFMGEKRLVRLMHKESEVARYLMDWLKKSPDII